MEEIVLCVPAKDEKKVEDVVDDEEEPRVMTVADDNGDCDCAGPDEESSSSSAKTLVDCLSHYVAILKRTREDRGKRSEQFAIRVDGPVQYPPSLRKYVGASAPERDDSPSAGSLIGGATPKAVDKSKQRDLDQTGPLSYSNWMRWSCMSLCLIVFLIAIGVPVYYWTDKDPVQGLAQCGDCHCSYADSNIQSCPQKPQTDFSEEFLQSLLSLKPLYQLPRLDCDPYQDGDCQIPFSSFRDNPDAVCALHFRDGSGSPCDLYWMVSYENATAAREAGAHVTHRGKCGLCSNLQDLVVYMRHHDLTTLGQECGVKGLTERENGIECFQSKLGMTEGCAAIWMANVRSTLHNCGGVCFLEDFLDRPYNGPAPGCELSQCLQCDEDNSGDIFKAFAGRTRRRSGLVSAIARPCDTIATEIHHQLPPRCFPDV